ncbi:unnamed protein product, partial [Callosobruchus maculatus]
YENRNILVQNSPSESDRTTSPPTGNPSCRDVSSLEGAASAQPSKTPPKPNDPPPLPPKPKIVPIRPPNWGHMNGFYKPKEANVVAAGAATVVAVSTADHRTQAMFLEQSSSSFV